MTYLALAKAAEARLRGAPQGPPTAPAPAAGPAPREHPSRGGAPGVDALAALLAGELEPLTTPVAVESAILGRIYLVRDETQAAALRARGGVPYTPAEVGILRDLWAAVPRDEWAKRLRAIHAAKQEFEGELC